MTYAQLKKLPEPDQARCIADSLERSTPAQAEAIRRQAYDMENARKPLGRKAI